MELWAMQWDRQHLWRFRARYFRDVDGDTFVALPDCGFDGAALPHIRIEGLWKPESWQEGGRFATDDLRRALTENLIYDTWNLRIESKMRETVISPVKTFHRYVATVWVVRPNGLMVDVRSILQPHE